jgi:hypothetical protein
MRWGNGHGRDFGMALPGMAAVIGYAAWRRFTVF